jgi:hypothetical protein
LASLSGVFSKKKTYTIWTSTNICPKGLSVALIAGTTSDEDFDQRFYSGIYFNYGLPLKKAGFVNLKYNVWWLSA